MSDLKSFCPRCEKQVDFTVVPGVVAEMATCPECGEKFALDSIKSDVPQADESGGLGHALLRIFLILLVVFLVVLAFIFAACSQGLRNI